MLGCVHAHMCDGPWPQVGALRSPTIFPLQAGDRGSWRGIQPGSDSPRLEGQRPATPPEHPAKTGDVPLRGLWVCPSP